MPSRKRAPLGRQAAVLAKLQMTRWRQKAWRDKPEVMEAIRQRATIRAKEVKDDQIRLLRLYIADLPDRMTGPELDQLLVKEYAEQRKVTKASFFRRVKRHGLLVYDATTGHWQNLCRVAPPANPLNL